MGVEGVLLLPLVGRERSRAPHPGPPHEGEGEKAEPTFSLPLVGRAGVGAGAPSEFRLAFADPTHPPTLTPTPSRDSLSL